MMLNWPWSPYPSPNPIDNAIHASQAALHSAYLTGFKDGMLLALAVFSILLVLWRKD